MEPTDLLAILARGEDSRHQFKVDATNASSLAAEMVAFANSGGGQLFFGVTDEGQARGLEPQAVTRLNQLIANSAANGVRPAINPVTENVAVDGGVIIVATIPSGISKPYMDSQGAIWARAGAISAG